jgi:hypothetical protein
MRPRRSSGGSAASSDTIGLILAVTVTAAGLPENALGIRLLDQAKEKYPTTSKSWVDTGFKNAVVQLNEQQRRLMMGAEARILGHGGIRAVARAAQVSETTVRKGVDELEVGEEPLGRYAGPVVAGRRLWTLIRDCGPRCWHWWTLMNGAIRCRRCVGR